MILWGRTEKCLKETAEEITLSGTECHYFVCDVANREEVYKQAKVVREKVRQHFPPLLIAVFPSGFPIRVGDLWGSTNIELKKGKSSNRIDRCSLFQVGDVSILVNNAAVVHGKSLMDSDDDALLKSQHINTMGQFWVRLAQVWATIRGNLPPPDCSRQFHFSVRA